MKRGRKNSKASDHLSNEDEGKKLKTAEEESAGVFQNPDWGNLIPDVVLQVFQYLPLLDRAHASQVCRRWNQVFHMPELWRCFEFELNQPDTSNLKATHPELIKQIIKRHSNHLQYVSFKVSTLEFVWVSFEEKPVNCRLNIKIQQLYLHTHIAITLV